MLDLKNNEYIYYSLPKKGEEYWFIQDKKLFWNISNECKFDKEMFAKTTLYKDRSYVSDIFMREVENNG